MKPALVLSGGGARGSYQVGVLKAISDLREKKSRNPFSILSGTSSGAINAVALAASANNFRLAVKKVELFWKNLHVDQVYKASAWDLMVSSSTLLASLLNDGIGKRSPLALLNNDPLRELLSHSIQFKNIQKRIDAGFLDAVAINATGYTSGDSVTFFQGHCELDSWRRSRRVGISSMLGVEHLMASTAIPTIFPAEKIGQEYFGDGALRQLAPISPAIKMGADRIMVIGVSSNPSSPLPKDMPAHSPSMAQMVGHLFNSAFIDSIEHDLDMLVRFNDLIGMTENENPYTYFGEMRKIPLLAIYPSVEFDQLAANHIQDLPWAMRRLMKTTGATGEGGGASFASYLLFESGFCKDLIDCGYRDAMQQEQAIIDFFKD